MKTTEIHNREILLKEILNRFEDKITGGSAKRIVGNPLNRFFVGRLSPLTEKADINSSKSFVHQIGIDFYIDKKSYANGDLKISPSFDLYTRVLPNYCEQIKSIESENLQNDKDAKPKIAEVFEKTEVNKISLTIELDKLLEHNSIRYDNLIQHFNLFEVIDKLDKYYDREIRCHPKNYKNEVEWGKFIESNNKRDRITPFWDLKLTIDRKEIDSEKDMISIRLINNTIEDSDYSSNKLKRIVNTIFNANLQISLDGVIVIPKSLVYFKDDYKYNSKILFSGSNINVDYEMLQSNKYKVNTNNIPMYCQKKLKTKDAFSNDYLILFDDLIDKPIITLTKIKLMMKKEIVRWEKKYKEFEANGLTDLAKATLEKELNDFRMEYKRFCVSIKCIEDYTYVRESFILMNKVFRCNRKGYKSWRLFQIVFIVLQILDIHAIENGEDVFQENRLSAADILYFPTGGGKTEAFLGVTVFNLFYDRFRGKNKGTTAIIKYPLRLLSVQQIQRVAEVVAISDKFRKEHSEIGKLGEFSIGYFVGDINTPNKIESKLSERLENLSQNSLNEDYRILDNCPYCKCEVDVVYDKYENRLAHKCSNKNCDCNGYLPVYIVDNEVYRYLPSVIISTIDKLATIGMQMNFRTIFGGNLKKCRHGYTSKGKCIDKICDEREMESVYLPKAAPTLIVQDELHLVRESLGTFDGHYETLFTYFVEELIHEKSKLKIIGATATISEYERQIRNLYNRDSVLFPSKSIFKDENFYSKMDEEEVSRYIIGYAPYGKAIINSVAHSLKYLRQVIDELYWNLGEIVELENFDIGSKTKEESLDYARELLKDYWMFLQYNNVKLDSNKILNAIDGVINTELRHQGNTEFEYRKMTGDDKFQDVKKILAEVESKETNVFNTFNLISATSMISHGVDANRFNLMFFLGMPGNTAEYIQAYSRVGRAYPGLVIDILRPSRDRDISYLKYFKEFHEYKDILVEPVPINRWATKAVDSTLPGVLMAILINYIDQKRSDNYGSIHFPNNVKKLIEDNIINKEELIEHIEKAYGVRDRDGYIDQSGLKYQRVIKKGVDDFIKYFQENDFLDKNEFLSDVLFKVFQKKPMNSMRDTEKQVLITLR